MEEKNNQTKEFCDDLLDISKLDLDPFEDLYWWYFRDCSQPLKNEIIANVSTLIPIQFIAYAKYVRFELNDEFPDNPDETYIDKWIEGLNLNIEDFPFFDNQKIVKYLNKHWHTYDGETEQKRARFMQKDFFNYASILEVRKILKFLKELTPDLESRSVDHNIFISENGPQLFIKLLDYLNLRDVTTRGNRAKFAGIWQADLSKHMIFKASATKKEYLDYLNNIFDSDFTTKSFSDGSNHERTINEWLSKQGG